jgi:glucokinase
VVIGGGLSNAYKLFAPAMMEQINGKIETMAGVSIDRLEVKAFDLENPNQKETFLKSSPKKVRVPNSNREVEHNWQKHVAIGPTKLGTSKAVAIGAYAYALRRIS